MPEIAREKVLINVEAILFHSVGLDSILDGLVNEIKNKFCKLDLQ